MTDYTEMTFKRLMERCMGRVPDSMDKREGSILYDAMAPAVAELAIAYMNLSTEMDRAFIDTAADVDLTNKAKERGILRQPASYAVRRGVFTDPNGAGKDIPIGNRFSGGDLNFVAVERISTGVFRLRCETAGAAGNQYRGILFPIEHIGGLGSATLSDVLLPGEDEEDDGSLRQRWYDSLEGQAFGGNITDYREKVKAMQGVGMVRVFPAWDGGGTVKLVLVDSEGHVPSAELVQAVQEAVDPPALSGQGVGTAPIGHKVTVEAVTARMVDVSMQVTLASGYLWEDVRPEVEAQIEAYLSQLTDTWEDAPVVVRVSRLESRVLEVEGVLDVTGTTLGDAAENLALSETEIPTLGVVTNATA